MHNRLTDFGLPQIALGSIIDKLVKQQVQYVVHNNTEVCVHMYFRLRSNHR